MEGGWVAEVGPASGIWAFTWPFSEPVRECLLAARPSLAIWALLPLTSVMRRIRVEEATLAAYFGDRYARYQHRTWCLIPWVF